MTAAEQNEIYLEQTFKQMAEKWPSVMVARTEISKFTGGLITTGYLANLDNRGLGPATRVRMGKKVVYRVDDFINWMRTHFAPQVEDGHKKTLDELLSQ